MYSELDLKTRDVRWNQAIYNSFQFFNTSVCHWVQTTRLTRGQTHSQILQKVFQPSLCKTDDKVGLDVSKCISAHVNLTTLDIFWLVLEFC